FGFAAWGTLAAGTLWSYYYGDRRIAFCLGLTVLMFFPVSNLVLRIGTIMGERLFYLPSAGLCLLAGLKYERVLSGREVRGSRFDVQGSESSVQRSEFSKLRTSNLALRTILRLLVVGLCLMLTWRTIVRNLDWFSDETVFQSALGVVPRSAKVYAQIG